MSGSDPARARAQEHVELVAEKANKTIDEDVASLMDSFRDIVGLAAIRDKDAYQATQDALEAEARAHSMVRAAQSLTLLSHALKLSLTRSLEVIDTSSFAHSPASPSSTPHEDPAASLHASRAITPNEEARNLISATKRERARCFQLLQRLGLEQVWQDDSHPEEESSASSSGSEEGEHEPSPLSGLGGANAIARVTLLAPQAALDPSEPSGTAALPRAAPITKDPSGSDGTTKYAGQSPTTVQVAGQSENAEREALDTLATLPEESNELQVAEQVEEDAEMEDVEVG